MKSAYELAMERLMEEDPDGGITLSEDQKEALADIEKTYKAKIAEKEIFLKGKLREAIMNHEQEAALQLEKQLKDEKLRLQEEREIEKDKIRNKSK